MNFGLWNEDTLTQQEACKNLLDTLIAYIDQRRGRILDVGCGWGATTRYLTQFWRPENIVGINLTEAQIEVCKYTAPGCRFLVMDATSLDFESESFRNIICVESAQHFFTREAFLREAVRILEPNGMLVMSDLLVYDEAGSESALFPTENYLPSLAAYQQLLYSVGFSEVGLVDVTESGWASFARFSVREMHEEWFSARISFSELQRKLAFVYSGVALFSHNIIVAARK